MIDAVELARDLIRCPSVTPAEGGALGHLQKVLEGLGFVCHRLRFSDTDTPDVDNLYARYGTAAPNFCFAGHTDVVPTGPLDGWTVDPFAAEIRDGFLYGRGAVDMKKRDRRLHRRRCGRDRGRRVKGSISYLITGDEEGPSINGTKKVLGWLVEQGERIDHCIVGEPTNPSRIGEMMKIGRRGSMNSILTVKGKQGHVAYPHLADNGRSGGAHDRRADPRAARRGYRAFPTLQSADHHRRCRQSDENVIPWRPSRVSICASTTCRARTC